MLHEAEWIEAEAWADAAEGAPGWLRAALGVKAMRWGSTTALRASRIDSLLFNRVMGLARSYSGAPIIIEEMVRHYEAAGVARFFLHVAAPDERWDNLMRRHGLVKFRRPWVKLARDRNGPVPDLRTGYPIGPARPDEARAYAKVLADGLEAGDSAIPLLAGTVGRPGWTTLVARDGEQVVGAAGLFVRDGIASLAGAATAPSHRRRGIQGALMAQRVKLALDLDCSVISSETGVAVPDQPNSSCNNMQRCGLKILAKIENYTWPDTTTWAAQRAG